MGINQQIIQINNMRSAIFLDRDGVINRAFIINGLPHSPKNITELEILPNVPEALNILHKKNYLLN